MLNKGSPVSIDDKILGVVMQHIPIEGNTYKGVLEFNSETAFVVVKNGLLNSAFIEIDGKKTRVKKLEFFEFLQRHKAV